MKSIIFHKHTETQRPILTQLSLLNPHRLARARKCRKKKVRQNVLYHKPRHHDTNPDLIPSVFARVAQRPCPQTGAGANFALSPLENHNTHPVSPSPPLPVLLPASSASSQVAASARSLRSAVAECVTLGRVPPQVVDED